MAETNNCAHYARHFARDPVVLDRQSQSPSSWERRDQARDPRDAAKGPGGALVTTEERVMLAQLGLLWGGRKQSRLERMGCEVATDVAADTGMVGSRNSWRTKRTSDRQTREIYGGWVGGGYKLMTGFTRSLETESRDSLKAHQPT